MPTSVLDYLLRDAVAGGVYDDLLGRMLSDGHPVMPRELATLVHLESTMLLDQVTEICMARGEHCSGGDVQLARFGSAVAERSGIRGL